MLQLTDTPFKRNDIEIATVKLGKNDHFVTVIKEPSLDFSSTDKKFVYDPFDRRDKKQVVTDQNKVKDYLGARTDNDILYMSVQGDFVTTALDKMLNRMKK